MPENENVFGLSHKDAWHFLNCLTIISEAILMSLFPNFIIQNVYLQFKYIIFLTIKTVQYHCVQRNKSTGFTVDCFVF